MERTSPSSSCTLPGQLQLSLVNGQGNPLPVDEQPAPLCTGSCAPQETITLASGESAAARFIWQNWCPQSPTDSVAIQLTQPAVSTPLDGTPRCDVADAPSTLSIGPTEKLRQ